MLTFSRASPALHPAEFDCTSPQSQHFKVKPEALDHRYRACGSCRIRLYFPAEPRHSKSNPRHYRRLFDTVPAAAAEFAKITSLTPCLRVLLNSVTSPQKHEAFDHRYRACGSRRIRAEPQHSSTLRSTINTMPAAATDSNCTQNNEAQKMS